MAEIQLFENLESEDAKNLNTEKILLNLNLSKPSSMHIKNKNYVFNILVIFGIK